MTIDLNRTREREEKIASSLPTLLDGVEGVELPYWQLLCLVEEADMRLFECLYRVDDDGGVRRRW